MICLLWVGFLETVSWEVEAWKVLEKYVCGVKAEVRLRRESCFVEK